jgi:hypothetical protein
MRENPLWRVAHKVTRSLNTFRRAAAMSCTDHGLLAFEERLGRTLATAIALARHSRRFR